MVKNLPCNAGDAGLIPVWGTKIPQSAEQPTPSAPEPALKDLPPLQLRPKAAAPLPKCISMGFLGGISDKEPTWQCRRHKRLGFEPWEDSLKEGMVTHSTILAWRIPWTEEPSRLQFMGSQRAEHD